MITTQLLNDLMRPMWSDTRISYDYNISETDKEYDLEIKVPGLTKSDISIDVEDGMLNIYGNKDVENKDYNKRGYETYYINKSFNIPEDVNIKKISAKVDNGILNVYLSKTEIKDNKIKIKIS